MNERVIDERVTNRKHGERSTRMSTRPAINGQWMTRRRMLGVAGGIAAAFPLAACGSGAPEAESGGDGGGGTFRAYWNNAHEYEAYKDVVAQFEKDHGVTVELQKFLWEDLRTKLVSDFQSGNVPDVVEEPGSWVQEFALSGDALSLQKYLGKDGTKIGFPDDWLEVAVADNTHDGQVYGIQMHYTCTLLFYNRKMLDDAGIEPPTTWDDFLAAARELTSGDVSGTVLNDGLSYSYPWMLQNGVHEYDADSGELLQPRAAAMEAMQFQRDLVHKHKVSPKPTTALDVTRSAKFFAAGRTAMILTGPWDIPIIKESNPDLDYGIAQALTGERQSTIAGGTTLFIPAKAKRPDLSWDFIKRITALKTETAATEESSMLMPRKSWAKESVVQENPDVKPFTEGLPYAEEFRTGVYTTGKAGELEDIYKTLYESMLIEGADAEEAFATYDDAAKNILKG